MHYQFKNITVLVVESSVPMFELTRSVLHAFGVRDIHSAYNAESGFEKFCAINPDLVILDWLKDPVNGLALSKRIRNDILSPNPCMPILLMAGYTQKKRVMQARDAGINEFLVKPYNAQSLYSKIERMIERPKHFVVSENYFGPERRHKSETGYSGHERRGVPLELDEQAPGTLSIHTAVSKAKEIKARHDKAAMFGDDQQ